MYRLRVDCERQGSFVLTRQAQQGYVYFDRVWREPAEQPRCANLNTNFCIENSAALQIRRCIHKFHRRPTQSAMTIHNIDAWFNNN